VADGRALSTKVNRGVAWAAGAQAVIAVTDLVSQMLVLALWVSPADYGIAGGAITLYALLDTAADSGVTSALIQRDDHTPERVSTVFWFNLMISSGLFVLLLGLGPLYGAVQGHRVIGWMLIAYGGKLVFQNVYAIPFAMLRKEMRFGEIARARMVAHVAESLGRVVFAALGATIWCWTLAALTRAFVFGVMMQLRHPWLPRLVFRPREVMDYVRFGLRTAASQILFRLYTSADIPIVLYVFGDQAAGIYSAALFIVLEPVKTISNVVIDVAYPTFARLRDHRQALVGQFLQFTRLNLLAVLPFVVLILLVIPEFLRIFYVHAKWSAAEVESCGEAARLLCLVGTLRALGFVGPPLLDGIGRPELTLRYMIVAAIAVPGSFVLSAELLGPRLGLLSVAVAWAVGYPIAFIALSYLVTRSLELPLWAYARASWGIVGCCLAGLAAGLAMSLALASASDLVRMVVIGATALIVTFALVATWQKITPRSIARAIKG
jgi:O-antigen/teichoic acid export membrane protein